MVREARTDERQLFDERRRHFGDALHVAAVTSVQHATRNLAAEFPTIPRHLRTLAQHLARDRELLVHDRRRTFLARQVESGFPACERHFTRHVFGELDRLARAVLHAEQRHRAAKTQKAHAVTTLTQDLVALPFERQAVDLDYVIEHAGEYFDHLAILSPIELRLGGEWTTHEARQIHRTQQARAVGRQRLLTARIGRTNVFAEPVVVHLVDTVDQDEPGLSEIVGGGHDDVPHTTRRQRLVDLAGDETRLIDDEVFVVRPVAPNELRLVLQIRLVGFVFLTKDREGELPFEIIAHRMHELVGDQQRQVELTQATVLALGANELHRIRVSDVEGAHLRAATTAR